MKNEVFILFSDGTWTSCNEIIKGEIIINHWWPFPLDKEGDSRRTVTIIENPSKITYLKNI